MTWEQEMVERLKKAVNGEKDRIVAEYAKMTGLSTATLYRRAKKNGFDAGRKKREDKGVLRCGLTDEQIEYIAALIHATARDNKGGIMPVERAIQIAEDNGILARGQISAARMQQLLREREISKKHMREATPHVEMKSDFPNEVHLVDVSVCIQYYLKNGRMRVMKESEFYKNKPDNFAKIKTRLLRYLLVDHFSGAFHLKYFDTTGETAINLFEFLCEGWLPKSDPRLPFHGVPFYMLWDAGSAALSKPMQEMFERLGIKTPEGLPHNPRRQGAVETMHNVIEQWFESGLKIQPATSVEQLNAWAQDWSIHFQATKAHTRHGMTRTACWLQIKPEQLRVTTFEVLQQLFARPAEERTVDGTRSISFMGKTYRLRHIDGIRPGSKVMVTLRPWHVQVGVLFRDVEYLVEPVEMLPASLGGFAADAVHIGEFRAQHETETQKAAKRFDNIAFGEEKKRGDVPFAGTQVYGIHADKVPNLAPLPKRSTPVEVARPTAPARIPVAKLIGMIREETGKAVAGTLNQALRAEFGDSIEVKTAEAVVAAIAEGSDWRQVEPKRAAL
jgi:hypothetical protein